MTNLTAGSHQSLLNRERLLFGGPLLLFTLLATGIGWFLVRPAHQRVATLETRLEEIQSLERQLPRLDLELANANENLITAQRQQALLVDLIAGKDRIQTFLALLDRISRATGVEIKRYEPLDETGAVTYNRASPTRFQYPSNQFFDFLTAQIQSSSTKTLASPTLIIQEGS